MADRGLDLTLISGWMRTYAVVQIWCVKWLENSKWRFSNKDLRIYLFIYFSKGGGGGCWRGALDGMNISKKAGRRLNHGKSL